MATLPEAIIKGIEVHGALKALKELRARVLALTEGSTPELVRNTDVLALIDEMMEEIPNAVND